MPKLPTCATLRVDTDPAADGAVTAIAGELDLASAPGMLSALREALQPASPLRLDLSGVTFMDSIGLQALATIKHQPPKSDPTSSSSGSPGASSACST